MADTAHITVSGAPEGYDARLLLNEAGRNGAPVVHVARDTTAFFRNTGIEGTSAAHRVGQHRAKLQGQFGVACREKLAPVIGMIERPRW